MREGTKRIVERFYEEIWNQQQPGAIEALCHEDMVFRGSLGEEKRGRGGFENYVGSVTSALGDYRCDIEELLIDGDDPGKAFAKMRFSGIHRGDFLGFPPSHRRIEWAGAALFVVEDGRVRSLWVLGDVHGLLKRLSEA